MSQLPIDEQIKILKYAYSKDEEKFVLEHILRVEPVDFSKSERKLTKGLLEVIVSGAVYPGNNEQDAQRLILALTNYYPEYNEVIYSICVDHLNEADESDDYEVYSRVFGLLVDIQSDDLRLFVKRCLEHNSPDIQEIVEGWNS